ncbi:MAG: hypothetical protein QM775_09495 [Pirellulales bacterium]
MAKFRCPKCHAVFASEAAAGHSTNCPMCHTTIRIPPDDNTPPPAAPESNESKPAADESSGAWKLIFPLAIVIGMARKFGCQSNQPSGSWQKLEQLSGNESGSPQDLTLIFIVIAVVGWIVVGALERLARKFNEPAAPPEVAPTAPPPPPPPHAVGGWWLHCDGRVVGPHSTGTVIDGLGRGEFTKNTQSCRAGETQWLPLAGRPEFAHACST